MLKNLSIRNYALIRDLDLEFGPGLMIITGETGAGKSIIMGALGLVMGGRADSKMIADGGARSEVTARFENVDSELKALLQEKGVEWIENDGISEISIRREISANGRSRIFLNDSSVTLQTLSLIAPRLIDIHSQNANAKINDPAERLRIIDALADNHEIFCRYRNLFSDYRSLRKDIADRKEKIAKDSANVEFMRFQLEQLERLKPKKGELAEIEKRFELLSDADEIKERLEQLSILLGNGDTGIQSMLSEASVIADKIDFRAFDKNESGNAEDSVNMRIRNLQVEIKDVFETVQEFENRIDTDPASLSKLSERMNLYYETVKRFKVEHADDLVAIHESLKEKLEVAMFGDSELPKLEQEARRIGRELKEAADSLSESRRQAADLFSRQIVESAMPLGLPNINFRAELKPRKLGLHGQDEVEFLCSFNKNSVLRPVGDVASGGESARLMLSLKSILARHLNLPTIIFDEVDTGVSGEIADKMGKMMQDMGKVMQVLAITHLPQVAAKGDAHYKVFKRDGENHTETLVSLLSDTDRVHELAAMISGSEISSAAINTARELLIK